MNKVIVITAFTCAAILATAALLQAAEGTPAAEPEGGGLPVPKDWEGEGKPSPIEPATMAGEDASAELSETGGLTKKAGGAEAAAEISATSVPAVSNTSVATTPETSASVVAGGEAEPEGGESAPVEISASKLPTEEEILSRMDLSCTEDKIDDMLLEQRPEAYRAFCEHIESRGDPSSRPILNRLAMKIEFAQAMLETPEANYAQRLEFCKAAEKIGEMYLDVDDPVRALKWEKITLGILENNQAARVLRNRIRQWYFDKLNAALKKGDWERARSVILGWSGLMPSDGGIEHARNAYGAARAVAMRTQLLNEGPEAVLSALSEERGVFPDLDNWEKVTASVCKSLQSPFDKAIAERKVPEAESVLNRQRKVIAGFSLSEENLPVSENAERLENLRIALLPGPLYRPFGMVIAPRVRFEAITNFGALTFRKSSESISRPDMTPEISMGYRYYRSRRSPWWFGGNLNFSMENSRDGDLEAEGQMLGLFGMLGRRGKRWSASGGLGFTIFGLHFLGLAYDDSISGYNIGELKAGGEYAVTGDWSAFASLQAGYSSKYRHYNLRLGTRYYIARNISLGLQYCVAETTVEDDSGRAEIYSRTGGFGPTAMLQF